MSLPIFFSANGIRANFRIVVTNKTELLLSGTVDEVVTWEDDKVQTPVEFVSILAFSMTWDGDLKLRFPDGQLRIDGSHRARNNGALIAWIYDWAEQELEDERNKAE